MPQHKQRRALSAARAGGRVRRGGEPDAAAALVAALDAPAREADTQDDLTHGVHSWPARMHPSTARHLVALVTGRRSGEHGEHRPGGAGPDRPPRGEHRPGDAGPDRPPRGEHRPGGAGPDRPLPPQGGGQGGGLLADPFCGSGTVLVEAQRAGLPAIGVDANPLAVLVARAKTWTAPPARRARLRSVGHELADAALAEGKAARRSGWEPPPRRTPAGTDPTRRNRLLKDWFAPHVRAEIEFLSAAIDEIADGDAELADRLRVPLSAILHKVSFRTSDTDPRKTERRVARGAAARLFRDRVDQLCDGLEQLARRGPPPPVQVHLGDARALDRAGVTAGALTGAVTSPPYGGTYDYVDQHRLRLEFLGLPIRPLERAEIGSRRSFRDPAARERAVAEWQRGLRAAFTSLAHSLAPGAHAAVILGDSLAGSTPLYADDLVAATCTDRLAVTAWAAQERRPLGTAEFRAFSRRRKEEWVFLLTRR